MRLKPQEEADLLFFKASLLEADNALLRAALQRARNALEPVARYQTTLEYRALAIKQATALLSVSAPPDQEPGT